MASTTITTTAVVEDGTSDNSNPASPRPYPPSRCVGNRPGLGRPLWRAAQVYSWGLPCLPKDVAAPPGYGSPRQK